MNLTASFAQLAELLLIVPMEIATNCLHKKGQLPLVTPTFSHQIGHFAANYPSFVVKTLNFCAADMCAKRGEKHRKEGSNTFFEA